jgi:predicted O-methyltransferase YrrM
VSSARDRSAARLTDLVVRAEADREALRKRLEPVMKVDRVLEKLNTLRRDVPAAAIGTGLGLSAMLLALPVGRSPIVRGGVALLQLGTSVWRLFTRR